MTTTRTTGRKAHAGERKAMLGRRMKVAAEQAGYTTTVAMAAAFGTDNATISRYWRGLQSPSPDELDRYAALVGKRLWWFWLDGSDDEFDLVAESLMEITNLAMTGRDLAASYNQVTGDAGRFGARERAELARGADSLRSRLTREVEGDWQQAPLRRRRAALDRVAEEALRPSEE